MGFLSKIIGGSIGEMADGVASAIDRFVETPEEKAAAVDDRIRRQLAVQIRLCLERLGGPRPDQPTGGSR